MYVNHKEETQCKVTEHESPNPSNYGLNITTTLLLKEWI